MYNEPMEQHRIPVGLQATPFVTCAMKSSQIIEVFGLTDGGYW